MLFGQIVQPASLRCPENTKSKDLRDFVNKLIMNQSSIQFHRHYSKKKFWVSSYVQVPCCILYKIVTKSTLGTAPILPDFPFESAVTGRPKRLARSSFFSSPATAAAGAAAPPKRAARIAARSASVMALMGLSVFPAASVTASVVLASTAVVAGSVFFSTALVVEGATMVVFATFGSGVLQ
jgi:hypothetical protein